jgi:hypothetical protein
MTKHQATSNLKNLIESGKLKSNLTVKVKNVTKNNSIEACIDVHLDRKEKRVIVTYDANEINLRRKEFFNNISTSFRNYTQSCLN